MFPIINKIAQILQITKEMEENRLTISEKIDIIKYNIKISAEKSGRKAEDIFLLPVSKTKPPEMIREVLKTGIDAIGENYVQEFLTKYEELKDEVKEFHFIGHLQSNKVKYIIDKTHLIHSVHSLDLLKEIDKRAKKIDLTKDVLIEVNYTKEESKSGIFEENLDSILYGAAELENINVKGLMMMPPATYNDDELKKTFYNFNELFLKKKDINFGENVSMETLSMGMSGDYQIAIENGSNMVRIGSTIFGERNYNN